MANKFSEIIDSKYPSFSSRCLDDGSFDPLQCIGDQCYCINQFYGTITENSNSFDINQMESAPCCKFFYCYTLGAYINFAFQLIKVYTRIMIICMSVKQPTRN